MEGRADEPWQLEFVPLGQAGGDALSEFMDELTPRQQAQLQRALSRLERHGLRLDGDYFEKITGSGLSAWRHTVQDCEVRFLYCLEERRFVMLAVFKKKKGKTPAKMIARATARWKAWKEENR